MLKPRKCRKLLLIITPQLKAAVGKKLYPINGKWAGDQFVQYVNASPSKRPQFGMVARKLGTIYRRHMEKHFSVDWTKLHDNNPGVSELPQRQTGQKALVEILSGKTGFARSKPTSLGGGNVTTSKIDFNHHDHVPDNTKKYYFALHGRPPETINGASMLNSQLLSQPRGKVHEGEVLPPELEIKGVHLKRSKLTTDEITEMVAKFGEIAEQQFIDGFKNGDKVIRPEDYDAMQEIGRRCMQRMFEKRGI